MIDSDDEFIPIEEVVRMLGFKGTSGVRALIKRGELRACARGARFKAFFRREDVLELMRRRARIHDARTKPPQWSRIPSEFAFRPYKVAPQQKRTANHSVDSSGDVEPEPLPPRRRHSKRLEKLHRRWREEKKRR
jgi:hypothetical protein